jgi:hypothetical protein
VADSVFTWPWYYAVGTVLLAAVLASWGWRIMRRGGFNATVLVIWLLALMLTFIKLPSYFIDEIRVDEERMQFRSGPWWSLSEGSLRFADIRSVSLAERVSGFRRSRTKRAVWVVESSQGSTEEFDVNDLWMEHYQAIQAHFVAKGIVIVDER